MTLEFSNPSRHFEAKRKCVCFWGYDSVIEISVFLETDALEKLCQKTIGEEAGYLKIFDDARKVIHEVAEKVYARGQGSSHVYFLAAEDF